MSRQRFALSLIAGAVALAVPAAAFANKTCYNKAEHAAEQTIRLHTELMIVGLSCQTVVPDKNPYGKYQEFTIRHRAHISDAEKVLIQHLRRTAKGNPTRVFDNYRTELANQISRRAATIGSWRYCVDFVESAEAAMKLETKDVKAMTTGGEGVDILHLSSRPLCDMKVASTPDSKPAPAVEPQRGKAAVAKGTPTPKPKPAGRTVAQR